MHEVNLTVCVLDFKKSIETRQCLESIKTNLLVPHKTVLLDNGGGGEYGWQYYKEGLCDVFISKRDGQGGGVGQTDLFRWSDTKYTMFIQNDQVLQEQINESVYGWMLNKFNEGFKCVDLAGDQGHGIWSDRAHLIETAFFNSCGPHPRGGTGPLHAEPWLEKYMQEVFKRPENRIFHIQNPIFFRDCGIWTIRQQPDGSICRMRTDTKALWWESAPKEKYVFPQMSESEWEKSIRGEWVNGDIPKSYLKHSFNCWGEQK